MSRLWPAVAVALVVVACGDRLTSGVGGPASPAPSASAIPATGSATAVVASATAGTVTGTIVPISPLPSGAPTPTPIVTPARTPSPTIAPTAGALSLGQLKYRLFDRARGPHCRAPRARGWA